MQANELHVVTVVSVEPRQRADELAGVLAVAKQLDTAAIAQRLAARGINAELRTTQGSITLAGPRLPSESSRTPARTLSARAPAPAEGAAIVAAKVGRARWPHFVSTATSRALSLAGAALLWRRAAQRRPVAVRPPPSAVDQKAPQQPPEALPFPRRPLRIDYNPRPRRARPIDPCTARAAPGHGTCPATDHARDGALPREMPPGRRVPAATVTTPGRAGSRFVGAVRIGLVVTAPLAGLRRLPDRRPCVGTQNGRIPEPVRRVPEDATDDRRAGRRDLDADHFVETLRDKRAQITKQIPVKDVRFKLAFHNGKAAIRYMTIA